MRSSKNKKATLIRLFKMLFKAYPVLLVLVFLAILFSSIATAIPTVFMQKVIAVIEEFVKQKDWDSAFSQILPLIVTLSIIYVVGVLLSLFYSQALAIICQGFLFKLRTKMFNHMQHLPIVYFDRNHDGDIMSYYTNDIDTLRQLISQSIPNLLISFLVVASNIIIMFYYSLWLSLVVMVGVFVMYFIIKKIAGNSSKFFIRQQKSLAKLEGYIEESFNGQKVIKVFNYEKRAIEKFEKLNEEMYMDAKNANSFANILAPILLNIGNCLYVLVALFGSIFLLFNVPNVSISNLAFSISVVVPFLNMTKQFVGNINQVSNQINSIIMGMAGAGRIFELLDQGKEKDEGYVTLVKGKYINNIFEEDDNGNYYWKHPHHDGTITYSQLEGDVILENVDFSYQKDKQILKGINVYAKPGQKVAFVGATGAGKTTITNLINRFYDIEDGKIRYDGININKIKKDDLRKSLGVVLQDTELFTGTIMDNIRYGNLKASDEQCIEAAKLANADNFIRRLPHGYNTYITGNGSNLSQGQKQLISIARCAVANPPVMILDEATSSIDTHTEVLVQKGMDALMQGRTVFVIAHRLSTIMNSDVIMVMDKGQIIERGDHDKLLAQKGIYYQLYTGAFELQ